MDDQPTPPFSRPLQKLSVTEFPPCKFLQFVDQFMGLRPQCDEVTIGTYWHSLSSLVQRVIDCVDMSMKRLNLEHLLSGVSDVPEPCVEPAERNARIIFNVDEVGNPLTLSGCQELQELEIFADRPGIMEVKTISSITSANIRRIAFTKVLSPDAFGPDYPGWAQLDDSLCQLVDRLEFGHRLEVEFRRLNLLRWWGEVGFKKCLPRSFEKGLARGG